MAIMDLEYIEIDGLLYPNIEIGGSEILKNLGRYGRLRLEYLHRFKQEMYRELLFSGKLAKHCATVDMRAFEHAEHIRADFLKRNPCLKKKRWSALPFRSRSRLLLMKLEKQN